MKRMLGRVAQPAARLTTELGVPVSTPITHFGNILSWKLVMKSFLRSFPLPLIKKSGVFSTVESIGIEYWLSV